MLENYCNIVHIEALTSIDIARREITPAVIGYQSFLIKEYNLKKKCNKKLACSLEEKLINKLAELSEKFSSALDKLDEDTDKFNTSWTNLEKAKYCKDVLLSDMLDLRKFADEMELICAKKYWPMPTYDDLLFFGV